MQSTRRPEASLRGATPALCRRRAARGAGGRTGASDRPRRWSRRRGRRGDVASWCPRTRGTGALGRSPRSRRIRLIFGPFDGARSRRRGGRGAASAVTAASFVLAHRHPSAALIEARGLAESETIRARGEAEATKIKAEGAKKAADLLEASDVAVKLAVIEKTGAALNDKSTVFFGADAKNLDAMLGPAVVAAATRAV